MAKVTDDVTSVNNVFDQIDIMLDMCIISHRGSLSSSVAKTLI